MLQGGLAYNLPAFVMTFVSGGLQYRHKMVLYQVYLYPGSPIAVRIPVLQGRPDLDGSLKYMSKNALLFGEFSWYFVLTSTISVNVYPTF